MLAVSDARGHESHGVSPSLRAKNTLNDFTPIIALDRETLWRAGKQANSETTVGIAGTLNCTDDQRGGILFAQDRHGLVPEVCGTISDGAHHGGGLNGQDAYSGRIIPVLETDPVAHTLSTQSAWATEDGTGRGSPLVAVSSGRGWWSESEVGATVRVQDSANKDDTLIAAETDLYMLNFQGSKSSCAVSTDGSSFTLNAMHGHDVHVVAQRDLVAARNSEPTGYAVTAGRQGDPRTKDCIYVNDISVSLPVDTSGSPPDRRQGGVLVHAGAQHDPLAFDESQITSKTNRSSVQGAVSPTINVMGRMSVASSDDAVAYNSYQRSESTVRVGMSVRRLTPRECERLQGFPDDYTLIPFRGKPAADGNRYRALGNSMAVNVMRWIGERIRLVEEKG